MERLILLEWSVKLIKLLEATILEGLFDMFNVYTECMYVLYFCAHVQKIVKEKSHVFGQHFHVFSSYNVSFVPSIPSLQCLSP